MAPRNHRPGVGNAVLCLGAGAGDTAGAGGGRDGGRGYARRGGGAVAGGEVVGLTFASPPPAPSHCACAAASRCRPGTARARCHRAGSCATPARTRDGMPYTRSPHSSLHHRRHAEGHRASLRAARADAHRACSTSCRETPCGRSGTPSRSTSRSRAGHRHHHRALSEVVAAHAEVPQMPKRVPGSLVLDRSCCRSRDRDDARGTPSRPDR